MGQHDLLCAAHCIARLAPTGIIWSAGSEEAMKQLKRFGPSLLLLLALLLPLTNPDPGTYSIFIYTLLFATAVTGWNLFSGYSGYVSLGYASFTGLGGYTLAIICDHWQIPGGYIPFFLLPIAGLVASIFAIPLGW